jgi:NAD(P)-dependent dehydrogenase (short-subunit alcohol dehydrogenase family)
MSDDFGCVWITGAGKGIGRAVALKLAARGRVVAASARTLSDLESLAAEAARLPGRIVPVPLDITDAAAAEAVVAQIEREVGPIGLAILNAGTHVPEHAEGFDLGAFRQVVDTNLGGTANCLAAVLPPLLERRKGRVALVASVAGYRGLPSAGAYGATKAALINLAESLAPELKQKGVTMTLISPGFVDTPLTRKNDFPMPFLIGADDAAERIVKGLDTNKFEIVFPRRMAFSMKLLRLLPYWLFFAITRGMVTPPAQPRDRQKAG